MRQLGAPGKLNLTDDVWRGWSRRAARRRWAASAGVHHGWLLCRPSAKRRAAGTDAHAESMATHCCAGCARSAGSRSACWHGADAPRSLQRGSDRGAVGMNGASQRSCLWRSPSSFAIRCASSVSSLPCASHGLTQRVVALSALQRRALRLREVRSRSCERVESARGDGRSRTASAHKPCRILHRAPAACAACQAPSVF